MMAHQQGFATHDPRPRAASANEAEAIVVAAIAALDALDPIIAAETRLIRDGQLSAALDLAHQKRDASLAYQRALQDIKANAISLGRHAPPSLTLLRQKHDLFAELMALNMAVVGTAKTVSESIVRELAAEVGQTRTPQGYGAYGQSPAAYRSQAVSLSVSKAS